MSQPSEAFSTLESFQALMSRCPFNRWLQLEAKSLSKDGVAIALPWRDELMSSPEAQSMHGGVLASLIDATASYAVAVHVGRGIPTVDLRIDYHKVAKPGDYLAKGPRDPGGTNAVLRRSPGVRRERHARRERPRRVPHSKPGVEACQHRSDSTIDSPGRWRSSRVPGRKAAGSVRVRR